MGAWGAADSCLPKNFFEGVRDVEVPQGGEVLSKEV